MRVRLRRPCADAAVRTTVPAHECAVDRFVADLAGELRGPRALRRDVLAEVRDGLHDAAEAHGDHPDAAGRAVAEFGSVAELAPLYQAELTAAQVRRTALVVTVLFPALVLGWDLLWSHGVAWTAPAPPVVGALARVQDVAGAVAAALGLGLLLATLRPRARPRRLAAATAAVGLGAVVVCAGTAVVMNLANATGTAGMLASSPAAVAAVVLSAAAATAVLVSSVRTLRLAR